MKLTKEETRFILNTAAARLQDAYSYYETEEYLTACVCIGEARGFLDIVISAPFFLHSSNITMKEEWENLMQEADRIKDLIERDLRIMYKVPQSVLL